ncbi:MAG: ABC transporter substrate-binding protein [Acidimicrobiales bacterium]|jgi:iron complex transport system substrate-binding protein|nr:ABC transporter substrate-binding protein [Acidimicrobiales bacterium]
MTPKVPTRVARRGLAAGLAAVVLALAGCGHDGATGAPEAATAPVSSLAEAPVPQLPAIVTSADGASVTVTDASRILPLWGNLAEIVVALGLGDALVGRDESATFAGADGLPVVTDGHDVSAEAVLSLQPTVVLAQTDTGPPEALDQVRAAGVPVVVLDAPTSLGDIGPRTRTVAAALGVPEAGERVVADLEDRIAAVAESVPEGRDRPRVAFLYVRGSAGVYLLGGPGSGADAMIEAAGGDDAGTEIGLSRPFTPLTSEALVEAAPDVVLVTRSGLDSVGGIDGLAALPGIAQTPAGTDRRIVALDDGVLYSFGTRTPLALAELSRGIHDTDEVPR